MEFEWDEQKNRLNQEKHGISFEVAQRAFSDLNRIIIRDDDHSREEQRFFCLGKIEQKVVTVRFTVRPGRIRIFGAGFWRKGRKRYVRENEGKEAQK